MHKITRFISTAALVLGMAISANAYVIYNTGVDNSSSLLALGSVDSHWTITAAPSPYGPDAFVANPIPGTYTANTTTAQWIAPSVNQSTDVFDVYGFFTYSQTFDLSGFDASTATLSGLLSSDNNITDVLINGVSTGITTSFTAFNQPPTAFLINSGFVSGLNTLSIIVQNGANPQVYAGPTALFVDNLVGTADRAIPEPSTYAMLALALGVCAFVVYRRKIA